jgi:hypothetical protein
MSTLPIEVHNAPGYPRHSCTDIISMIMILPDLGCININVRAIDAWKEGVGNLSRSHFHSPPMTAQKRVAPPKTQMLL